ncbi:MAG: redox-regulated ATPase YchF [Deltaproteobacteria bacterium]|nr:redox-regulated ATPase YchF [Deltaproteobacteria bacterium]
MKIGLYGYEGAGASTLFNALTGQNVVTGFGGDKEKVHIGTVKVPDSRIDRLTELYSPKKTVFAELVFSDFPSKSKDQKGKSLGNISEAKSVDILALVIKAFSDKYSEEEVDAASELEMLLTEMAILDLEQIERYIEKQSKVGKKDPQIIKIMEKMVPHLSEGLSIRTMELSESEVLAMRGFSFLSSKRALAAINVNEDKVAEGTAGDILEIAAKHGVMPFVLSAGVEEEITSMETEDQEMFLDDMGLTEPVSGRFIRAAYELSDLISFFTVGPDEVRSWPIARNTNARKAAGAIHSDLEKGFIRAEVFHYDDIIAVNGVESELKKLGKHRLEGKDYIVKDGDILNIRFNV